MEGESDTVRPLQGEKGECPGPAQTFAETPGEPKASITAATDAATVAGTGTGADTGGGGVSASSSSSSSSSATAAAAASAAAPPPTKKRRRNRKIDPDRKYACNFAGCTKSYSRAEHLQRHRLNHEPRRIYYCSYPGCRKQFVRQDLCVRHRERHSTVPPNFRQHKDAMIIDIKAAEDVASLSQVPPNGQEEGISSHNTKVAPSLPKTSSVCTSDHDHGTSSQLSPQETEITPPSSSITPYYGIYAKSDGIDALCTGLDYQQFQLPLKQPEIPSRKPSYAETTATAIQDPRIYAYNLTQAPQTTSIGPPVTSTPVADTFETSNHASVAAAPIAAFNAQPPLEPLELQGQPSRQSIAMTANSLPVTNPPSYASTLSGVPYPFPGAGSQKKQEQPTPAMVDTWMPQNQGAPFGNNAQWTTMDLASCPMSLFGGEVLAEPGHFAAGTDVYDWLFNGRNSSPSSPYDLSAVATNQYADPYTHISPGIFSQKCSLETPSTRPLSQNHLIAFENTQQGLHHHPHPHHHMLSDSKRLDIISYMRSHFTESVDGLGDGQRLGQIDELLQGDINSDDHILSLRMVRNYVASYWHYIHGQVPILHKPTFLPDHTCTPLLLSIIVLGAATLDGQFNQETLQRASRLATFIATHLRWKIFTHPHAQAPAKLWVFQALVLLELYEKIYSTRSLHERAHTHHDGLLTLMRRGSSLITRSPESSPMPRGDGQGSREEGTGAAGGTGNEPMSAEQVWARFIETESTRRVAFAAFTMDSLHATMFGHSVKMVVHGLKLPLPCHEALWQASSPAEAAHVQHELGRLGQNITKPTMFLDALKKALNGNKVQTTAFGQAIIMSGLLSVSWNLSQRDIQAQSLGIAGGRDEWRKTLLRAFDHWVEEYDEAMLESARNPLLAPDYPRNRDLTFGSRNVLHHLAHMASHVDAIDCQRFAGAGCLMNRYTTLSGYEATVRRMLEWARKPSARDATYHALKLLSEVYISGGDDGDRAPHLVEYRARDDYLLHRPWAIYLATLIVWAYGYALDGPLSTNFGHLKGDGIQLTPYNYSSIQTPEAQRRDMFSFLTRAGSVNDPSELGLIPARNQCLGLLYVVRESLSNTRWELLTEAANLLGNCINKFQDFGSMPSWPPQAVPLSITTAQKTF